MGKENKLEAVMTVKEASDLLRQLADRLEGSTNEEMAPLLKEAGEIRKIEFAFKKKGQPERISIKMRVDRARPDWEHHSSDESYSELSGSEGSDPSPR